MDVKDISRRRVMQILPALPLIPVFRPEGETEAALAPITPRFYMLFFDQEAIDVEKLAQTNIPVDGVFMELIPLKLRDGQTLENAVKIYEVVGPNE